MAKTKGRGKQNKKIINMNIKKSYMRNLRDAGILSDEILQARIMQAGAVQRGDAKESRRCGEELRELEFLLYNPEY